MTLKSINKMNKHLTLNGRVFLFDDIINDPISLFEIRTEFEFNTILFCKEWLRGEKEFKINTSGSTGKPKSILITRNQMITSTEMTAKTFDLVTEDSILVNLNTKYIAGMMMLVRGLHLDLSITAIEPSSNPLNTIENSFDFYAFVPLQLQTIIESGNSELLNKAKAIIVGGAPISIYQENLFSDSSFPIYSTYGMTETCTHVAIRKIGEDNFKALENVVLSVDKNNCLIINSPTAIENPLITNDVVDLISETEFRWKGRIDNVINSGGVKIQIEELEAKIAKILTSINQDIRFIISSKSDEKLGEKIILITEKQIDTNTIESGLNKYEMPKEYHIINQFPETETGKIDRKKLKINLQFILKKSEIFLN